MRRIGVLMSYVADDPDMLARLDAFRHGFQGLGWVEGRNVHVDYRFSDGRADRFQPLAKELVALKPA
jgi:putative ABC transport system substrate-binding protein